MQVFDWAAPTKPHTAELIPIGSGAEESCMTQSFSLGISDLLATDDTVQQSSIIASFKRQAALRPFAPALEVNDRTLTYKTLDARSNCVARKLTELGVQSDEVVGICL